MKEKTKDGCCNIIVSICAVMLPKELIWGVVVLTFMIIGLAQIYVSEEGL